MNQEIDVSGASVLGDHRSRLLSDGAAGVGICEVLAVCAVRQPSYCSWRLNDMGRDLNVT
jgi:hypothetical protein